MVSIIVVTTHIYAYIERWEKKKEARKEKKRKERKLGQEERRGKTNENIHLWKLHNRIYDKLEFSWIYLCVGVGACMCEKERKGEMLM